jgi:hypothetical protein
MHTHRQLHIRHLKPHPQDRQSVPSILRFWKEAEFRQENRNQSLQVENTPRAGGFAAILWRRVQVESPLASASTSSTTKIGSVGSHVTAMAMASEGLESIAIISPPRRIRSSAK